MLGWGHTHKTLFPCPPIPIPWLIPRKQQKRRIKTNEFQQTIDIPGLGVTFGVGSGGCRSALLCAGGPRGQSPIAAPPPRFGQPCATPPALYLKNPSCHDYALQLSPALGAAGWVQEETGTPQPPPRLIDG